MRQTLSKGAFAAAAATGILSLYGSPALADSDASGVAKDSAGVLSGNNVQVPVDVPINLCGNTVNVLAALNESFGNVCRNGSHKGKGSGTDASGVAKGSSGVGSGNVVQVPIEVPVNVCGNNVTGLGFFNEAAENSCHNGSSGGYGSEDDTSKPSDEDRTVPPAKDRPTPHDEEKPDSPSAPEEDGKAPSTPEEESGRPPQLAETGSEALVAASVASAALMAGGVMLYRRGRTTWSR
ncbi:chaplin [Streptomyces africanus]|uniref:chaplin n=1 Tax=Streptomyces africanus TaxID=231024 RepID=UPI000A39652D|nr:chaplin [Streptomyces africanus]